mgnify:CR=1
MSYAQKQTYTNILSDLRLISRAIRESGYMSSHAHIADRHILEAAGALEAALEASDVERA